MSEYHSLKAKQIIQFNLIEKITTTSYKCKLKRKCIISNYDITNKFYPLRYEIDIAKTIDNRKTSLQKRLSSSYIMNKVGN